MRDTRDQATPELGDLPPYQYKPSERDSASKRARLLGYMGPKERPRCETCQNVHKWDHAKTNFACRLGNFPVMRGGLCDSYRNLCDSHSKGDQA